MTTRGFYKTILFAALCAIVATRLDAAIAVERGSDAKGAQYQLSPDGKVLEQYFGTAANFTIPTGVEEIGDEAFMESDSLVSVVFPHGLKKIGDSAFLGCDSLKITTFPESLREIGASAFASCDSLTTIEIPEGVKKIGASAFLNCASLKWVVVPRSVSSIGDSAFSSSGELTIRGFKGSRAYVYARTQNVNFERLTSPNNEEKGGVHIVIVVSTTPDVESFGQVWRERIEGVLSGELSDDLSSFLKFGFYPAEKQGGLGREGAASFAVLEGKDSEFENVLQVCRKTSEGAKAEDAIAVFVFAPADGGKTPYLGEKRAALMNAINSKDHRLAVLITDLYSATATNFEKMLPTLNIRALIPEVLPKNDSYLKRFLTEGYGEVNINSSGADQNALVEIAESAGRFSGSRFSAALTRVAANGYYLDDEANPYDFFRRLSQELTLELANYNRWSRGDDCLQTLTAFDADGQIDALGTLDLEVPEDDGALFKESGEFVENKEKKAIAVASGSYVPSL